MSWMTSWIHPQENDVKVSSENERNNNATPYNHQRRTIAQILDGLSTLF